MSRFTEAELRAVLAGFQARAVQDLVAGGEASADDLDHAEREWAAASAVVDWPTVYDKVRVIWDAKEQAEKRAAKERGRRAEITQAREELRKNGTGPV